MGQLKRLKASAFVALMASQIFSAAFAATSYAVNVDTGTLSGTSGYIDLQFNPGDLTAPTALADLANFNGSLTFNGSPTVDGDVTGAWPGAVLFGNSAALNAALQPVTFGSGFNFDVTFSGDYETAFGGSATRFSLGLLDSNLDPLATIDPIGTILQFELTPGGAVTATTFDADSNGTASVVTLSAVPLPAALPLLASALALLSLTRRRKEPHRGRTRITR